MTLDTARDRRACGARASRCFVADCHAPEQAPDAGAGQRRGQGGDGKGPGRVEHPFRIVKRVFGCDMVRYRGLDKNVQRLAPLLGFSNLMIARPHLS